jgi:putative addiction module component (TIGR02574 family)
MDMATILRETEKWPREEQLELADRLWERASERNGVPEPSAELKALLDERIAAYARDPTNVRTWDEIKARLLGRKK